MNPVILGSRGMLGSMVKRVLEDAQTINRPALDAASLQAYHKVWDGTRIINCIGLIKPYCNDVAQAIKVNALFPHTLPPGTIQIATDCVYSGAKGSYVETDPHDALDVYGKTKSLGEAEHLINLRCSIIGPEVKNHISLLDWFLAQEGEVTGFTNHLWNGITTYHFTKIVKGMLDSNLKFPPLQHIVPADVVTKAQLLQILSDEYNHRIPINEKPAPQAIDRTLATLDPEMNLKLWQLAGYDEPPTIRQMVKELANEVSR
jgi:dTDP-4-dehydrorhamnose reductase